MHNIFHKAAVFLGNGFAKKVSEAEKRVGTESLNSKYSTEDKREIYIYFFERIITNIVVLVLTVLIAAIFDIIKEVLAVYVSTFMIRRCFGGGHADNPYVCLVLSVAIPVLLGFLITLIDFNLIVIIMLYLIGFGICFKKGVVDNPKKRLSQSKKEMFRKQGIISFAILFIINIIMYLCTKQQISDGITIGMFIGSVNLLFGK